MAQYISKSDLVVEIESKKKYAQTLGNNAINNSMQQFYDGMKQGCVDILSLIDTLEVKDPYEQYIQYDSIKAGIQEHAETYSFNIESELFQQLTKEQQKLWRKEIEQACISGGEMGVELARDKRYKENLEVKEVNLKKEIDSWYYHLNIPENCNIPQTTIIIDIIEKTAKHFFELGLKASNPITTITKENLESLVRQVIGLYLEAGKHYNSVIKEERKEYGGSDLAIKLLGGIIDAKELSINYVLDKLKAQKGE